jgi:hypothetical protein
VDNGTGLRIGHPFLRDNFVDARTIRLRTQDSRPSKLTSLSIAFTPKIQGSSPHLNDFLSSICIANHMCVDANGSCPFASRYSVLDLGTGIYVAVTRSRREAPERGPSCPEKALTVVRRYALDDQTGGCLWRRA